MGLLFIALAVVYPEFGLLTLVFITYAQVSHVLIRHHGLPSIAKFLVPLLFLVVALRFWLFGERRALSLGPLVLVAAYGLVGFASLLYAENTVYTQQALITYGKDVIIVVVVMLLLQRGATLRNVIWTLLAAGTFMGTITVIQQLTGTFENDYWGFGQVAVKNIVGDTSDYRVSGPFSGSPNYYAQILVVLVPLALNRLQYERSALHRLLAGWALAVCTFSIIFTFSRTGFLALMVVAALVFLSRRPRPVTILATAVTLFAVLQLAPGKYVERMSTLKSAASGGLEEEGSLRGRLSEAKAAMMMFSENPVLGVGYHNYKTHYRRYSEQLGLDSRREERAAHSLYLEIAAEQGVVGLAVFGAILLYAFAGMFGARQAARRADLADWAGIIEAFALG